jgi:hypothetical protein
MDGAVAEIGRPKWDEVSMGALSAIETGGIAGLLSEAPENSCELHNSQELHPVP